jgi:ribonuclease HII
VIIGVDEVGMGAWAGPIVVGVVATPLSQPRGWDGVRDSKRLSVAGRRRMFRLIVASAPWAVGMATNIEVDNLGLVSARREAARRALTNIILKYPGHPLLQASRVIFDGSSCFGLSPWDFPSLRISEWRHLNKADEIVREVSAASICAKYVRDFWMTAIAHRPEFSAWGFQTSAGYGTPYHKSMLDVLGPSKLHRLSVRPVADAAWSLVCIT